MPSAGFESTIQTIRQLQTYALDRTTTVNGYKLITTFNKFVLRLELFIIITGHNCNVS